MERVELTRDCEAVQIPAGTPATLEKGIEVFIHQSLGGTYTLQVPAYGGLFRIAAKDADAVGKTPEEASQTTADNGDSVRARRQVKRLRRRAVLLAVNQKSASTGSRRDQQDA